MLPTAGSKFSTVGIRGDDNLGMQQGAMQLCVLSNNKMRSGQLCTKITYCQCSGYVTCASST